jgi:hypothetical protein
VTRPLKVDVAALEGVARRLDALSDQLGGAVIHEWQPPAPQPTGQATVAVTAAGNHVLAQCSGNLLLVADQLAQAARYYATRDSTEAQTLNTTMQQPN